MQYLAALLPPLTVTAGIAYGLWAIFRADRREIRAQEQMDRDAANTSAATTDAADPRSDDTTRTSTSPAEPNVEPR